MEFKSYRVCRCLALTCRGIQFNEGNCKILFETTDVPESERSKYNQTSLTSNGEMKILSNGQFYRMLFNVLYTHGHQRKGNVFTPVFDSFHGEGGGESSLVRCLGR